MTKTELLADIDTRVLRTISVTKEPDAVKEAQGINTYVANVLNLNAGKATGQNIAFYVLDEGTPTEQAIYKDDAGAKVALEAETVAFIASLPYVKVKVDEVNANEEFVLATAYEEDTTTGTVSTKKIMLYKDSAGVPQEKTIV